MYKLISFLLLFYLVSCTPKLTEKQRKEIFAFREMSELATVEYTLSKVVKVSDNGTWFKLGDRKIVMSVVAYAKAGIDLSGIKDENIQLSNNLLTIQIPRAKLISLNIPPEEIKEESVETDFWRDRFSNEEKNALLTQAENSIRQSIDSLGILATAEENARLFISNFVKRLGYKNIMVSFEAVDKPITNPAHQ